MALTKRNNTIDLLRFLAAVSVALFHNYYNLADKPDTLYTAFFFNYGKLGVPIFFVISGYCIMIALNHAKTSIEFIIRRLFRIFPPYWFSLLFTVAIVIILKLLRGENSVTILPKTPHDIFLTFLLLTYPFTKVKGINWVYWTLLYEVLFYFAVFLCSFLKNNYFTLLLLLITIGSCFVPSTDLGFQSFFKFWPIFAIGVALFKLLHDDKQKQLLNMMLFGLSLYAFYPAHQTLPFFVASVLAIIVIVIGHYYPLRDNKISKLGDVSYSIYLIHVPLTVYCFSMYRELSPLKKNGYLNPLLDTVLLILVIGCSKLIYSYIELPSISLGKRVASYFTKGQRRTTGFPVDNGKPIS
jgi:peptidoglycan/LPS O-acetylase OafA/YrhL